MMRKKIVSLCMALVLCLSLLPVTALAAAPSGQELYVGNVKITSTGYWTTDDDGNVTAYSGAGTPSDNYIYYDESTNTLTLHNATIKESVSTETNSFIAGAAIGVHNQNGAAELTITLEGTNTIAEVGKGIYVLASSNSTGDASLTITSESGGSLDASGSSNPGIWVQSNSGNATLTIQNAEVTATSTDGDGVQVRSGAQKSASLTVDGGSLTATGMSEYGAGIRYTFGSSSSGSGTPSLTVSGNAIVKASGGEGGISDNSSTDIQIGVGDNSSGGIVFDGNKGTVYGSVTLQEDLTVENGQTLTIPDGASLNTDGMLTVDGGTLTGDVTGTVNYKVTGVSLNTDSLTLEEGGTATLTATITPSNATDQNVTWSSDNESVATVDQNGRVTAVAQGGATITAAVDGKSAKCSVTVNAAAPVPVTSVSLDKTSLGLTEGDTETLTATVEPSDATNKNVTWSTSDASIATVTDGVVTAVAPGTATITVTTVDQSKTATCTVTVTVPVTGVTLNKTRTSLYVGDTETLTATVAPDNATNQAVTWTSSNPSVATVKNGVVTAVAPGIAVITATTQDGNHTAACAVTVRPDVPPANPNYRITVEATQGGTVTADPTAAKAGTTVTLTPVPHRGYQVGTVAVTDRFGEAVAVTEQADGTYTFTMPNGQVTVTVTFEETPLPFTDVTEGDWFYDAVRCAYENSLMDGVGDNLFAPNSETTRAQLATILYRLEGEPEVSGTSGFTDVEAGTWYTDAVAWAAANGIVNGVSETEFAPGKDITREQLATILFRYAEAKGYDVSARADLSAYPDADQIQSYAAESVAWAVAEGLIQGFEDNTLRPAGNATRAQIATILMRFCEGVAK